MIIRFSIQGEIQLSRVIATISATVKDMTPAFEKSGEDLLRIFSYDVFETEGQAVDETWSPLSKAYAKRKERQFPGKGILEATGKMRQSFMAKADDTSLTLWNAMEYFKYHQSNQPRTVIPRRVMLKLTENMREMVVKNMQVYLAEQVG